MEYEIVAIVKSVFIENKDKDRDMDDDVNAVEVVSFTMQLGEMP